MPSGQENIQAGWSGHSELRRAERDQPPQPIDPEPRDGFSEVKIALGLSKRVVAMHLSNKKSVKIITLGPNKICHYQPPEGIVC
jgi:hypothetical protein